MTLPQQQRRRRHLQQQRTDRYSALESLPAMHRKTACVHSGGSTCELDETDYPNCRPQTHDNTTAASFVSQRWSTRLQTERTVRKWARGPTLMLPFDSMATLQNILHEHVRRGLGQRLNMSTRSKMAVAVSCKFV